MIGASAVADDPSPCCTTNGGSDPPPSPSNALTSNCPARIARRDSPRFANPRAVIRWAKGSRPRTLGRVNATVIEFCYDGGR